MTFSAQADSRLITRCVSAPWGRTSIKLEPEFWAEIDRIASSGKGVGDVVAEAVRHFPSAPLTSAVRVYTLRQLRAELEKVSDVVSG